MYRLNQEIPIWFSVDELPNIKQRITFFQVIDNSIYNISLTIKNIINNERIDKIKDYTLFECIINDIILIIKEIE